MKSIINIFVSGIFLIFTDAVSQEREPELEGEKNEVSVFAGGTSNLMNHSTSATVGIEYLRLLGKEGTWAVGVVGESVFAKHTEFLFTGLIYFSPFNTEKNNLWIWTGPGIEYLKEEEPDPPDPMETKTVSEFVYRIGAGYFWEFKRFNVAPTVDIDIIRDNTSLVWGVNVGYGF